MKKLNASAWVVAALGAAMLSACGSQPTGGESVAANPIATTVTQAPVTVTAQPATVTQAVQADRSPGTDLPESAVAPEDGRVPMPDVVGMNLQGAQDKIQSLGVFFSRSEDASGAGRAQVLDRNWIVVGQTPEPGVLIGEGDALLRVKKIGE